jgi:methyl-accepting chemotaxis protein
MDVWTALIIIVLIVFGSIFGPSIIQELRRGFGEPSRNSPQRNNETAQELQGLRQEVAEMRAAYNDKILSLEKSVKELRQSMAQVEVGTLRLEHSLEERAEGSEAGEGKRVQKRMGEI